MGRWKRWTFGSVTAVKNVSLAEDYLHDHFPGYPVLPHALDLLTGRPESGQAHRDV